MALEQNVIAYLEKDDLEDWREHQALMAAITQNGDKFSAAETISANLREMVLLSRFFNTYRLSTTKFYDFSPVHGAIVEAEASVAFTADDE